MISTDGAVRQKRYGKIILPKMIWDGERLINGTAVEIADGRIRRLIPSAAVPETPAQHVLRLEDSVLMPGLIDCHVHLDTWMLSGFLAAGVTTVRDLGNDLEWILDAKSLTENDPTVGPRILCAGPLLDGKRSIWPEISIRNDDCTDIRRSIRYLASEKVDVIKLYAGLRTEQVLAGFDEAQRHSLPVAAHLGTEVTNDLLHVGMDLQHLSGLVVNNGEAWRARPDALAVASRADMVHCPTVSVWDRLSRINDNSLRFDTRLEWVHSDARLAWETFPNRTAPVKDRVERMHGMALIKEALASLVTAGATIVAGSDTPFPFLVPGFSLHDELGFLVDAGLSAESALKSATSTAARALGLDDRIGRIRPGLRADLIAVDGDPLNDITDLARVRVVFRDGIQINPADLVATRRAHLLSKPTGAVTRMMDRHSKNSPLSPKVDPGLYLLNRHDSGSR